MMPKNCTKVASCKSFWLLWMQSEPVDYELDYEQSMWLHYVLLRSLMLCLSIVLLLNPAWSWQCRDEKNCPRGLLINRPFFCRLQDSFVYFCDEEFLSIARLLRDGSCVSVPVAIWDWLVFEVRRCFFVSIVFSTIRASTCMVATSHSFFCNLFCTAYEYAVHSV